MIKFRQKEFGIREGSYTGPKDQEKTPSAITTIARTAGVGSIIGAVVGKVINGKDEDYSLLSGAFEGAKYGTLSGIALKIFLNYLHNPMKTVKYQDVDRLIRREFGIYRVSGITVGDSVSAKASIDEKFGFNDRNVTDYKLTFCVSNNKVTMYTLGMTDSELDKTDRLLDYYCKKFSGMSYSSLAINEKANAYSVVITFTNYQAISSFIMELSNLLETRVNLIDNDILLRRVQFADEIAENDDEEASRNFSIASIGKDDIPKLLANSTNVFLSSVRRFKLGLKQSLCCLITSIIYGAVELLGEREFAKLNIPVPRFMLGNDYLKSALTKMRYIDGFHYTSGEEGADANISLVNGLFLITAKKGDISEKIDKGFWNREKLKINRSIANNEVVVYTYSVKSKQELDLFLNLLMKLDINFNIFEK